MTRHKCVEDPKVILCRGNRQSASRIKMAEVDSSYSWIVWGVPLIVFICLGLIILVIFLVRRHIRGPMYKGVADDMTGKVVLITGANTGIGKETARDLAKRGAKVTMLCRNLEKATAAAEELTQDASNPVRVQELDLSSFESIRTCATAIKNQEPKIHVLINNAGVMVCPQWETKDGLEMQIGTNHFGHFLLTLLLLENIKAASPSRIVNVSSLAHKYGRMHWDDLHMRKNYSASDAYNQSKLANVLFTKALATKLKATGVTVYALHPGVVATELGRHIDSVYGSCLNSISKAIQASFAKDSVLGAQTSIACAVDRQIGTETGKYYNDCKPESASKRGRSSEDADKLWEISLDTVGLGDFSV